MSHKCHWPGCEVAVLPAVWGCKPHWFALPKRLRDRIWEAYRRWQEVTKSPSPEYITAAQDVQPNASFTGGSPKASPSGGSDSCMAPTEKPHA